VCQRVKAEKKVPALQKKLDIIIAQEYPRTIPGFFEGAPSHELHGTFFFGDRTTVRSFEKEQFCTYHFFQGLVSGPLSFVVRQELTVNTKATTIVYCLGYKETAMNKTWIFIGEQRFTVTRETNRLLPPKAFRRLPEKIVMANSDLAERADALFLELKEDFESKCMKAEALKAQVLKPPPDNTMDNATQKQRKPRSPTSYNKFVGAILEVGGTMAMAAKLWPKGGASKGILDSIITTAVTELKSSGGADAMTCSDEKRYGQQRRGSKRTNRRRLKERAASNKDDDDESDDEDESDNEDESEEEDESDQEDESDEEDEESDDKDESDDEDEDVTEYEEESKRKRKRKRKRKSKSTEKGKRKGKRKVKAPR